MNKKIEVRFGVEYKWYEEDEQWGAIIDVYLPREYSKPIKVFRSKEEIFYYNLNREFNHIVGDYIIIERVFYSNSFEEVEEEAKEKIKEVVEKLKRIKKRNRQEKKKEKKETFIYEI